MVNGFVSGLNTFNNFGTVQWFVKGILVGQFKLKKDNILV